MQCVVEKKTEFFLNSSMVMYHRQLVFIHTMLNDRHI